MGAFAVLQFHYSLGFLSTAAAFGVLAWCMAVFRTRRGYVVPALTWIANLLLYNLTVILRSGSAGGFSGSDALSLWAHVIRLQGLITILFIFAWLVLECLPSFRKGGQAA